MIDFIKFAAFIIIAWTLAMASTVAAGLVGVVLALWVLYWLSTVWNEEIDDETDGSSDSTGESPDSTDHYN